MTPIYKSGDRHSPASYRFISLTSIPCKILERLIKKVIVDHLPRNNLISDMQHGFLPGRSCSTNLLLFMDSLTQARDDGLISHAIFFDFAEAFDKVPHKPLLHKLEAYGVCCELLQWINSFLTDRSFCVKVDQTLSSPATVHSGVPKGSVIGPLLFLVYINDLTDVISSRSLLYADDFKIWTSDNPDVLQEDIISIKNWSTSWSLPIIDTKCAHMSIRGASGNHFIITTVPRQTTFLLSTSRRTWVFGSHPAYPSHITTLWLQRRVHRSEYDQRNLSTDQPRRFSAALRNLCPASPGIRQLCRSLRTANGYELFGESTTHSHSICQ